MDGPPAYWLRYGAAPSAFGRARDLLCPYFDEGRCTVWSFREAVCATYYCKHEQGADGLAFWQAVRQYLAELGEALVTHALLELGFGPEQSLERPAADLTPEELDGLPLPAAEYGARWGRWAGREEDCFREAHRVVAALGPDGAAAVGGARLRARLAQVEAAGQALAAPRLPQRLRRNPQLKVFRDGPAYVLEGYSPPGPLPRRGGRPRAAGRVRRPAARRGGPGAEGPGASVPVGGAPACAASPQGPGGRRARGGRRYHGVAGGVLARGNRSPGEGRAMSETKKPGQADADETQELTAEELDRVSGGPTAVERMLLPAVKPGQVVPTDQFSLNFTKVK